MLCISDHLGFKELDFNYIDFHPILLFASQIHRCLNNFSQSLKTVFLILTDGSNYKGKITLLLRRRLI